MQVVIPSQTVEVADQGVIELINDDSNQILQGQPCYISGDGRAKKASAMSRATCTGIVFLDDSQTIVQVGAAGKFRNSGFITSPDPLVPGSTYFLGINYGTMIQNDAPPLPNETVELGVAVTQFKLAI